jgi:prepilin-type N-terminal cleavage/methylation domain-containing protein
MKTIFRIFTSCVSSCSNQRLQTRSNFWKGGFTLIESLVVIAIIAILASLVLPTLAKAKASSKRAACVSNCRQWALALSMYEDEQRGYPPSSGHSFEWTVGIGWNPPST